MRGLQPGLAVWVGKKILGHATWPTTSIGPKFPGMHEYFVFSSQFPAWVNWASNSYELDGCRGRVSDGLSIDARENLFPKPPPTMGYTTLELWGASSRGWRLDIFGSYCGGRFVPPFRDVQMSLDLLRADRLMEEDSTFSPPSTWQNSLGPYRWLMSERASGRAIKAEQWRKRTKSWLIFILPLEI